VSLNLKEAVPTCYAGGHQDPAHHVGEDPRSPPVTILSDDGREHAEEQQQLMSRPGSKPPCCDRKCGACAPCKAVQVRAGANYEPVWWTCKCGGAVFDP